MDLRLRIAPLLAMLLASPAVAAVKIDLFPNIGPSTVTDNGAYLPGYSETQTIRDYTHNALGAMLDNQLNRGGSILDTPTAFNTLPDHKVRYTDIIASEFPSWRLDTSPTGAFANEQGTWYRVGLRVESDTPFTLDHLSVAQEFPVGAPFEANSRTIPDLVSLYPEGGFSPTLMLGIYYGADGIRGTGDDIFCDSSACDLATQPLNLFVWRGYGKFEYWSPQDISDYYGGDYDAWREDERRFYGGLDPWVGDHPTPFVFHFNYTLTNAGGAIIASKDWNAVVTGVPEPANWALLITGFGLMGGAARWRRQNPILASNRGA